MLALELIDSGLLLARRRDESSEVLTESPGIAFLGDDTTRTGDAAVERIRLNPLLAHTNFWRGLSTEELTRPSRLARTTADIAFAQAEQLLGSYKSEAESVLLAVPAGNRDMNVSKGGAGLAIQPRYALMRFGAGLLAVVTTDAQRFVDDQDVGRLAQALVHQEVHQRARFGPHLHARLVDHAPAHIFLQRVQACVVAPC